jgi:hypothetical protein
MNKNYLVGSKVRLYTSKKRFIEGVITRITSYIEVEFKERVGYRYFELNGFDGKESKYCLEVIGHTSEKIAIAFANYCISEGYGTDARPQDFQKFLETYKPQNNG